jgi:hypothetical protein
MKNMQTKTDAENIVSNSGVVNWDWGNNPDGTPRNSEDVQEQLADYVWQHGNEWTSEISDKMLAGFVSEVLGDDPEEYNLHQVDYYHKKYILKNESGQYWTGECWGVRQAAQDYEEEELPESFGDYISCSNMETRADYRRWTDGEEDATAEEITSPVA